MLLGIIRQFNWVDIFVLILLLRICYIAVKNGFPVEFFKLCGTVFAVYLALHYYTSLSDIIRQRMFGPKMPLQFLDFLCFLFLSIAGYLIFVLLRQVFCRFIKMEAAPKLNKWGGLILGACRGVLLSSLVIFAFIISHVAYFKNSAYGSYSGRRLFKVAPAAYAKIWESFASKFMAREKFNEVVAEVEADFIKP